MTAPAVPSVGSLATSILAAFDAAFSTTVNRVAKSFFDVVSKVWAALNVTLFKFQQWAILQQYVETAEFKETVFLGKTVRPLVALGTERGVSAPKAATQAEHSVQVTVIDQVGTLLPGEPLLGTVNGVTYSITGSVALNAATVTVTIRAAADQAGGDGSGAQGNLEAGAIVVFANPRASVQREAVVLARTIDGAEGETAEEYRIRVLDRYQKQPEGGAPVDYEFWGEDVAGIVAVYPYKGDPGEIDVYCEATPSSSGSPDGIPTPAQLAAVLAAIEEDVYGKASHRQANAYVNTYGITRTAFGVRVLGLTAPDLAQTKTDITTALATKFATYEPYIPGVSVGARKDFITEPEIIAAVSGVLVVSGATYSAIYLTLGGVRESFYTLGEGEKAKVTVSWA